MSYNDLITGINHVTNRARYPFSTIYYMQEHELFLEIINRDDPKLTLAFNKDDKCWGWYGYDGMGRYVFLEIKNQEVLNSAEYYFNQNLLRKIKDVYAVENGCECTLYEIA